MKSHLNFKYGTQQAKKNIRLYYHYIIEMQKQHYQFMILMKNKVLKALKSGPNSYKNLVQQIKFEPQQPINLIQNVKSIQIQHKNMQQIQMHYFLQQVAKITQEYKKPSIKLDKKYLNKVEMKKIKNLKQKINVPLQRLVLNRMRINKKSKEVFAVELNQFIFLSLIKMDQLFQSFDQFMKIHLISFLPHQQSLIIQQWDEFLALLQTTPLDYGKIYSLINQVNIEENRERSSARVNSRLVSNNTTSPRINISQQKTTVSKTSHLDQLQSPKINLSSQQQAALQKSQKTQVEDFNRLLLISKIKEQLFNYAVSTDKLYAIARITTTKEVQRVSRSPNRQICNKQKTNNQSVEHYRIIA